MDRMILKNYTRHKTTRNDNGGLQNHKNIFSIIIENEAFEYLQNTKSVNPVQKQNATHFFDLCAKVSHLR